MKKLIELVRVMRVEGMTLRKVWGMVWSLRAGVVGRRRRKERAELCGRCPLYNREMRQCRPFPGHRLGCGCYVPLLVWARRPYEKGCWGRTYVNLPDFGWE